MKIYVGRWDLLPSEWEGFNGLVEKSEEEIKAECARQMDCSDICDNLIGGYTPQELEGTFDTDTKNQFTTETYWIRIF